MCGIGGFIGIRDAIKAKKMISKIKHRGPDSDDYWISDNDEFPLTICHTRLSILDLSIAGTQPMFSKDKNFVLTFNGEIYNYLELKKNLEAKGTNFVTETDTEVLLEGLILEGEDFLLKCNGMWSFCLWNRKQQKAILCRDRFGVKPLYYHLQNNNNLIFSSEMKAITPFLKEIKPNRYMDDCIQNLFNYETSQYCSIEGIESLEPGQILIFENQKIFKKRFWNTLDHINFENASYEDQIEKWGFLFRDSVKIRMRSDVPIGSALSGGLDSSGVVGMISDILKNNNNNLDSFKVFCNSFPGAINDETEWAEKVAFNKGLYLNKVVLDSNEFDLSLEDAYAKLEDPYLTLPHPFFSTYKKIKDIGISVSLDGHGADELFSGYGHIKRAFSCCSSPRELSELKAINESTKTGIFSQKEKRIRRDWLKEKIYAVLRIYYHKTKNYFSKISPAIFGIPNFRNIPMANTFKKHNTYLEMDAFNQILFEIFHCTILPTLLRNYDKYAMSNGVEIRMPFMDWRLVTYSFSIPYSSKIGAGYSKRIERDAFKYILPDSIRFRRQKLGWNAPSHLWLKKIFRENINNILRSNKEHTLYDPALKSWTNFLAKNNPSYSDGENTLKFLLPLIWNQAIKSDIWR